MAATDKRPTVLENLRAADSDATLAESSDASLSFKGRWLRDADGRTVMLRGVNLSGSSKNPATPEKIPSHVLDGFFDHRTVGFVGRPFPLDEADQHFSRLKDWGFNCLRFIVTWEAIEHAGPGEYDMEFINYIIEILSKAKEYGFKVFIDPHQDVWSRFSGGSGAPGWTLDLVGFDMKNFAHTEAAMVHNTYPNPVQFEKMIWSTNYYKLVAATMYTLFYAGEIFAPNCIVDNVNIQEFLQKHYLDAFELLATHIRDAALDDSVVVGYDTMNEPSWGWVGASDLSKIPSFQELRRGRTPTPFQAMLLGEGVTTKVELWDLQWYGFAKVGTETINPQGRRAWLDEEPKNEEPKNYPWTKAMEFPKGCIWAAHGVWDKTSQKLLRPDYFASHPRTKQPVDWYEQCFKPFVRRYANMIRSVQPRAIIFIQPPVNEVPPPLQKGADPTERIIYSPHWYDGLTLVNKDFGWWNFDYLGLKRGKYVGILPALKIGFRAIRQSFVEQLGWIKQEGIDYFGEVPCIIGEIGIPMDLEDGKAFSTGDYTQQNKALDANINALEANLLNYTLWNYVSDNDHKWGDGWNGEDLSVYSPDDEKAEKLPTLLSIVHRDNPHAGGRAVESLLRPFPFRTYGEPLSLSFDPFSHVFRFRYKNLESNPPKDAPTEIYLPRLHYDKLENFTVTVSSGKWNWDEKEQKLLYWHDVVEDGGMHSISVERKNDIRAGRSDRWFPCICGT